jgi:hypothetical protein
VSAAAAVAEAASEVLASAPPAMAAALSILDPLRPANCATDLENTARDAAESSWPATLMRSAPELPWKNFCMSLTSAPGCGNGASAKLSPVARPPTKLTPVSTPLRAEGSFIGDPFVTANPRFWSEISMWQCELATR